MNIKAGGLNLSGKRQGNMHKEMDYQFLLRKQSNRMMTGLNPGWSFDHPQKKMNLFCANMCYLDHTVLNGMTLKTFSKLFDPAWLFKCRMGIWC